MTIKEALEWGAKRLKEAGMDDAELEASWLLSDLLGLKRHELTLARSRALTKAEADGYSSFIERRSRREPAQYITGQAGFMGFSFKVDASVLVPRPETELIVEEAVRPLGGAGQAGGKAPIIIDLCTGSGCIAVSVARLLPSAIVYATDISARALGVAKTNAVANGVDGRITFMEGDLFMPLEGLELEGRADLLLSNPPYVADGDIKSLMPEVRDYEPLSALAGGKDGLDFIRRIVSGAPAFLKPGGRLLMEIGFGQSGKVREIIEGDGRYEGVRLLKDLAGIERVASTKRRYLEG